MALHRGRIDLFAAHLERDPDLLHRTFRHREIYPSEMGCGAPLDATVGTPLAWGRRFHAPVFVSEPAMRLIEQAGAGE